MAKYEMKEVSLKGSFSVEESKKDGKVHVYSDKDAFVNSLPDGIKVDELKAINKAQGAYLSEAVNVSVKNAISEFKKGEDEYKAKFPFGANANSHATVHIRKAVEQVVPGKDGGPATKVVMPQIRLKVKEQYYGGPGSTAMKAHKDEIQDKIK